MDMTSILKPEAIRVLSAASSKKRLFHELGSIVEQVYGVPHSEAVEALQERENLGPAGVGHGVALPHARLDGLDDVVGALVLMETPIDFDAVDRQPVDGELSVQIQAAQKLCRQQYAGSSRFAAGLRHLPRVSGTRTTGRRRSPCVPGARHGSARDDGVRWR